MNLGGLYTFRLYLSTLPFVHFSTVSSHSQNSEPKMDTEMYLSIYLSQSRPRSSLFRYFVLFCTLLFLLTFLYMYFLLFYTIYLTHLTHTTHLHTHLQIPCYVPPFHSRWCLFVIFRCTHLVIPPAFSFSSDVVYCSQIFRCNSVTCCYC